MEKWNMRATARALTVLLALACLLLDLLLPAAAWAMPGQAGAARKTQPASRSALAAERYTLATPVVGQGSVVRDPDQADYAPGQVVELTAVPDPGWVFAGWSGGATGTNLTINVTMTGNLTVTATFSRDRYSLVILIAGQGTVARSPNQALYYYGDQVTLTANPAPGWSFNHWSGALTGSENPKTLTMTDNHSVLATFTEAEYTLTTQVVGQGSIQRNPDQATYHEGDQVELRAVPALGWRFTGWSGGLTGSVNPKTLTITGDVTVTATFAVAEYTLTVNIDGQGQVAKNPQQATYHYGDTVTLTATPAQDWSFAFWSGGATGSQNPKTIIISGDTQVTAHFEPPRYSLTTQVVGQGSIQRDPNQATYYLDSQVELRAVPALGWRFTGWSGGLTGSVNPKTLTITGDVTVTATFAVAEYTLTVNIDGQGQVAKNPQQATYHYGDTVTLTATPAQDWSFAFWSGGATGSQNPKTIIISGDTQVTAHFEPPRYTLTTQVVGQGSIQRDPNQATYYLDSQVELRAIPALGWRFTGWSGGLTGSVNPKTLTITGDVTVTATFVPIEYTLDINVVGQGQVTKSPQQATYHYGDTVTLTAVHDPGWAFDHWSGDLGGSQNPRTITIYGNKQVTAHFVQRSYTLAVQVVGQGSVQREPSLPAYHYGDKVKMTAKPALGWSFVGWSGALTGSDNPQTLTITGDAQVTATFARIEYTLTVSVDGQGQVTRNPQGATYHYGDVVTLTAVPDLGWSFDRWSGGASGSENPKTITITGNVAITARFSQDAYTLDIQIVGQGSVSRDPARQTYHYGDEVTLAATADHGWSFAGWSGDATGSGSPKTIIITGNMQITATFAPREYVIAVTFVGRGKVLFQPNQKTFRLGDKVSLTGWAPLGWQFSSWSGDVSGTENPVSLVVSDDHQVTATFVADPPGTKYRAHLPWLVEAWPPLPHEPAMLGISNPEGYGDYTVRWGDSLWATTYTMQEARNIAFAGATQLYHGPLTYYQASGRGAGRYFYRTKAHNSWGDSGWSSVSSVDVRREKEPNNEPLTQANGPIISGLTYFGTFASGSDLVDYFTFELGTRRGVQASLTEIATGHNYDLILEDAGLRQVAGAQEIGNVDEYIQTDKLEPGRYYVRVVNASRSASTQSYRLRVVYE